MITRNLKNILKLMYLAEGKYNGQYSTLKFPNNIIKNTDGSFASSFSGYNGALTHPFSYTPSMASALQDVSQMGDSGVRIRFGTGTTEPTELDYRLESEISGYSGFSVITNSNSVTNDFNEDFSKYVRTMKINMVLRNTGTEDITINEMGLTYGWLNWRGATGYTYYNENLIYREVLDEPITVVPNGLFTLTKTITVEHDASTYDVFEE